MTVREKLRSMILLRERLQGKALQEEDFQKAAALDEQMKGIEVVYESLIGTGALDFELNREKGEQDGKAEDVHKDV